MRSLSPKRFLWWFCVYLIQAGGLPSLMAPVKLPLEEGRKLQGACLSSDVLIILNPGGWGDASLERADDFRPILEGIQDTLKDLGYSSQVVPYLRTLPDFVGRVAGVKDQILGYRYSGPLQVKEIKQLAEAFPRKRFIIAGFSTGGGLSGRSLKGLDHLNNVLGITVGVPGWFKTYASDSSLVLNNSGHDPLVAGDIYSVTYHVIRAPYVWLRSRLKGQNLSVALSFHFPHHEYTWDSDEVGPPITQFLKSHLG
jgi:hypothetical protein